MGPPRRPDIDHLLKMGGVSLAIHIVLAILLSLNPWPTIIKVQPTAYTVNLVPIAVPEPETRFKQSPLPPIKEEEKQKPITKPKKDDIVEKVKKSPKKVEKSEEKKPDLILLDLILPKKDGFSVLEELKAKPELSSIPVIVLSNLEGGKDVERCLAYGVHSYLAKANYSLDEIAQKVKEALE